MFMSTHYKIELKVQCWKLMVLIWSMLVLQTSFMFKYVARAGLHWYGSWRKSENSWSTLILLFSFSRWCLPVNEHWRNTWLMVSLYFHWSSLFLLYSVQKNYFMRSFWALRWFLLPGYCSGLCYYDNEVARFELENEGISGSANVSFAWVIFFYLFSSCNLHKDVWP